MQSRKRELLKQQPRLFLSSFPAMLENEADLPLPALRARVPQDVRLARISSSEENCNVFLKASAPQSCDPAVLARRW